MKLSRLFFVLSLVIMATIGVQAQTDDISISATFTSSIDCTVTSGSNISFTVASLSDYTNGLSHATNYSSTFEVNSSVDFQVDLTATDFSDGSGNTIDADNFGYTIEDNGTYTVGTNHKLLGATDSPSSIALLGSDEEVVTATGSGNAGNAASNSFILKFQLGTSAVRAVSGLSDLLNQNISPGTYTSTVTLTASATP